MPTEYEVREHSDDKLANKVVISKPTAFVLTLLAILIAVGVGIIVHFAGSNRSVDCQCSCPNVEVQTSAVITDPAPVYGQCKDYTVNAVSDAETTEFESGIIVTTVKGLQINEASGVCASRRYKDVLYTHNDSGGRHFIYAFSATSGARLATIVIDGATALDWEDIACGPCAGGVGHCIYVADTGGNAGGRDDTIYRIQEPTFLQDQTVELDGVLRFQWNEVDSETIMVDPQGEVYVVSKVAAGLESKLYRLPSNGWGQTNRTQVDGGVVIAVRSSWYGPTAGDISPNGTEVLIKTYCYVYYWNVPDGDYFTHLQQMPAKVPYIVERQGESVCFASQGTGYYTVGEGNNPPLYYYGRNETGTVG